MMRFSPAAASASDADADASSIYDAAIASSSVEAIASSVAAPPPVEIFCDGNRVVKIRANDVNIKNLDTANFYPACPKTLFFAILDFSASMTDHMSKMDKFVEELHRLLGPKTMTCLFGRNAKIVFGSDFANKYSRARSEVDSGGTDYTPAFKLLFLVTLLIDARNKFMRKELSEKYLDVFYETLAGPENVELMRLVLDIATFINNNNFTKVDALFFTDGMSGSGGRFGRGANRSAPTEGVFGQNEPAVEKPAKKPDQSLDQSLLETLQADIKKMSGGGSAFEQYVISKMIRMGHRFSFWTLSKTMIAATHIRNVMLSHGLNDMRDFKVPDELFDALYSRVGQLGACVNKICLEFVNSHGMKSKIEFEMPPNGFTLLDKFSNAELVGAKVITFSSEVVELEIKQDDTLSDQLREQEAISRELQELIKEFVIIPIKNATEELLATFNKKTHFKKGAELRKGIDFIRQVIVGKINYSESKSEDESGLEIIFDQVMKHFFSNVFKLPESVNN
jgi:hypothetical protein